MQVKFISTWQIPCGITEYAQALKKELDALADVQMVTVPVPRNRKGLLALLDEINKGDIAHIQYTQDFYGSWRYPGVLRNFIFFLKHIRIPVVITVHDMLYGLSFLKSNRISLKRIFYNSVIVPFINWTPYGRFLHGGFLDKACHLIVFNTTSRLFLQSLNIDAEKISLLYPSVPNIETPNNESIREWLGLKSQRLITIFGFIRPQKGYETVIKIMKQLPQDVILLIAGGLRDEGYNLYLAELKALVSSLGLEDKVKITGYLDNDKILSVLSASDIILLPYVSPIIGGSYAFSYAIAAKRPVVTSNIPFFSEIEQQYSAMKMFKTTDSQSLIETISEALDCHGQEAPGAAEYRKIWSWKNVAQKTYKIYCDVLLKSCINKE